MIDPFQSYGVKETTTNPRREDRYVEEIRISGYAVVPEVVTRADAEGLSARLDAIYAKQVNEISGEATLAGINDANVARCLLAYDRVFLDLAANAAILGIIERLLGDRFILQQQNGVINRPAVDHYQVSWHRDLPYQHFVSSRPLAISVLVCLDDFRPATGSTHLLPASHRVESFPSREFVESHEFAIDAPAGSAIVFDSLLFHRAGVNRSHNIRRGVNHVYALPFLKQQISLPQILGGQYRDDDFLTWFLGYTTESGQSVTEWRNRKLASRPPVAP